MGLKFTKMQGLGNDFMVIDAINQQVDLAPDDIVRLARRDTGVGFDQCLLVEKSSRDDSDFFYRIFNADGQEVGQCGNGARCLARFVRHYGLTNKRKIHIATHTTQMHVELNDDESVTVIMEKPKREPADIPIQASPIGSLYTIPLRNGKQCAVHAIQVGNPHAVMVVDDINTAPVQTLGQEISEHVLFPKQTNVGFMQLINPTHIKLRVYERGCGETKACGSGAVAAVAVGRLYHQLAEKVTVSLILGDLMVHWQSADSAISLTGPAEFVYEGHLM